VTLERLSHWIEVAVGVVVVVTVVLLFTNEPEAPPPGAAVVDAYGQTIDGAAIFRDNCATCHGGDGSGGIGPRLAGGRVVAVYPDPADQIAVVTNGRAGMPAFGAKLTDDEIAAVVEYTRTVLAGG
jgi:mono/diheme cytochrome c family protein